MNKNEIMKNFRNSMDNCFLDGSHHLGCYLNGKFGFSDSECSYGNHWSDYIEDYCFPRTQGNMSDEDFDWAHDYNNPEYDYVEKESVEFYVNDDLKYIIIVDNKEKTTLTTLIELIRYYRKEKYEILLVDNNFKVVSSLR